MTPEARYALMCLSVGIPDAANFEAFFKKILHENKIEYCVAPYAAHGQASKSLEYRDHLI
jgi:hypothetical protein